jgi:hypothetical protein
VVREGVREAGRVGVKLRMVGVGVRLGMVGVEVGVISRGVAVLIKGVADCLMLGTAGNKVGVGGKVEVGRGWFPSATVSKSAPSINPNETRAVTIPQMTWRVFCILAL